MVQHGVSPDDVLAWPVDDTARDALSAYLQRSESSAGAMVDGLAAPQSDFRGADLSGLDLSEAYLLGAVLTGVSMAGADLARATLSGAELEGANLSDAKLAKAEFVEAVANRVVLLRADAFAADFSRCELRHADARAAQLNSARLRGADLSHADLREAVLSTARFGNDRRPTLLAHARLGGAVLTGASGVVVGPVDVGTSERPDIRHGAELAQWFADQGAAEVTVAAA